MNQHILREYGSVTLLVILEFLLAGAMRFVPRTEFYASVVGGTYGTFAGYLIALFPTAAALAALGFFVGFLRFGSARKAHNLIPALIFFLFSLWTAVFLWLEVGKAGLIFDADAVIIAVIDPNSIYSVDRIVFDPQFVGVLIAFIILFASLLLRQVRQDKNAL